MGMIFEAGSYEVLGLLKSPADLQEKISEGKGALYAGGMLE